MTSSRETVLCQYHYDPLDRLISHELSEISERKRFYCKSRLATEIQGTLRYSIVQHGDQLLAQQRREGDSADTTLLATDKQRSVLEALKANHPVQSIAYSPYGNRTDEGGLLSLLAFNGERPDPVTGCYLLGNGYRAFNPVLMRFTSPDSLSPFGKGGLNSYAYCTGDPVNKSDPSGHMYRIVTAVKRYPSIKKPTAARLLENYGAATGTTTKQTKPLEVPTLKELSFRTLDPRFARELVEDNALPIEFSQPPFQRSLKVSDVIAERMSLLNPKKTYQKNDLIVNIYEEGLRGDLPEITAAQATAELIKDANERPFLRSAFPMTFFEARHNKMDLSKVIRNGY